MVIFVDETVCWYKDSNIFVLKSRYSYNFRTIFPTVTFFLTLIVNQLTSQFACMVQHSSYTWRWMQWGRKIAWQNLKWLETFCYVFIKDKGFSYFWWFFMKFKDCFMKTLTLWRLEAFFFDPLVKIAHDLFLIMISSLLLNEDYFKSNCLPRNSQKPGLFLFNSVASWTVAMQMKAINMANVKWSISLVYSIPSFVGRKLGIIV